MPGAVVTVDPNSNATAAPITTRQPTLYDPFTLFNTNTSYGLNSIVSSEATSLEDESREGFEYVGELCSFLIPQ